ncbi:MAG: VTT domain-containing protein, partial [Rubricoccaceae bacterium]
AVALALTGAVVWWVDGLGGPAGLRARYGLLAPAVTFPAHVVTTLTPVGELLPFGVANGALYGMWMGAALNWAAWMVAAVLQHAFGRTVRRRVTAPVWVRRLPLGHPLVLLFGRWLPGGGVLVDAAAGAAGVPLVRLLAWAAAGHAPQAVLIAALGDGLLELV